MSDKDIIEFFSGNGEITNKSVITKAVKCNSEIKDYLAGRFDFTDDVYESAWLIVHKLNKRPVCPVCGKDLRFINIYKGYNKYCTMTCRNLSPEWQQKYKNTCQKKYGVDNGAQSDFSKQKTVQTNLERHGIRLKHLK